eukprot:m.75477 g.75477  ORF g.75477 m.75477 type:complete len:141 (-) comp18963_c0_seq1:140-562(-)
MASGSSAAGPVPFIADNKPMKVQLEAGKTYYWCQCGRSQNQPFCDGSHKGTGLKPKKFVADKTESKWLCMCKFTENAPFCDGSHRKPDVLTAYNRQLLQANSQYCDQIHRLEEDQKKYKIACLVLSVAAAALALKGKLRL